MASVANARAAHERQCRREAERAAHEAQVLELYTKDWTYTAIGRELGLTKNQVAGLINRSSQAQEIRPTRKRQPPKPVLLTGLAAVEARLGWANVTVGGCRWIHGHPTDPDWHWCGAERMPDSPYCAAHLAAAYKPLKLTAKDQAA
jgi:GcrA cell cycle regulator